MLLVKRNTLLFIFIFSSDIYVFIISDISQLSKPQDSDSGSKLLSLMVSH